MTETVDVSVTDAALLEVESWLVVGEIEQLKDGLIVAVADIVAVLV